MLLWGFSIFYLKIHQQDTFVYNWNIVESVIKHDNAI